MTVETAVRPMPDLYFDLVKEFPLIRIRDGAHHAAAVAMIDRLLRMGAEPGVEEYLDVLTDMVGRYEDEHVRIPDASEADVLRELMATNRLSQLRLAKATGIAQSTLSAVLNGARALTKDQVIILSRFFRVPVSVFMPA